MCIFKLLAWCPDVLVSKHSGTFSKLKCYSKGLTLLLPCIRRDQIYASWTATPFRKCHYLVTNREIHLQRDSLLPVVCQSKQPHNTKTFVSNSLSLVYKYKIFSFSVTLGLFCFQTDVRTTISNKKDISTNI